MTLYPWDPDNGFDGFQGSGGGGQAPGAPGASGTGPNVQPYLAGGTGGNGGGGGGMGGYGRPTFDFRDAPDFIPPEFQRPTMKDAMNEPGYQFRLQGGADALEGSAAARGVLRTGGTLTDIEEYGQNFASSEYGNVYNRELQAFDRDYRGDYDAYAGQLAEWQLLSGAEMQAGLAQYGVNTRQQGGGGGGGNDWMPPIPPEPPENWWTKTGRPPVF